MPAPVFVSEAPDTYDTLVRADTVIVPAVRDVHEEAPAALVEAVTLAHASGARVASLCSGAFVLAAAGLLEGRKATTHWLYTDELARRFPAVNVDPDVLYIDNGDVLTSAGTTAAIDLCLAMVTTDHGADLANTLARRLVAPPHRSAGQAQYVEAPALPIRQNSAIPVCSHARNHAGFDHVGAAL
jgi:AraC family transcriptional regulator, transcriptional activator FtrA